MSMVLHVTCWAQECVSQEDGDHQWQNCPRGANSAWSGPSGAEGTKNPQCPRDMTPIDETFDPDKEWNELHKDMESEEDPSAGTGMDDDEEILPREQHTGEDAGEEGSFWHDLED